MDFQVGGGGEKEGELVSMSVFNNKILKFSKLKKGFGNMSTQGCRELIRVSEALKISPKLFWLNNYMQDVQIYRKKTGE